MEQQLDSIRRIAHATIVASDDREEGLRAAARLAQALVCRGEGTLPCGVCPACRKAEAGIHPDIIRVKRPTDDKGRPKKEIPVDLIRAVAADAPVLPNESERKVYLIEDADTMNLAAQNAALKLLEEPPAGVYFLLCATNPTLLLPTVRSRCARWICAGEERQRDPELQKLAESFLNLVARKDRAALLQWCFAREDLDGKRMRDFLDCAVDCVGDRAAGRAEAGGMSPAALLTLVRLLERCRGMLQVNTGVKHILGLLAVDAIAVERGV